MKPEQPDSPQSLSARLADLEGLFTHLQRTVQDLDEVVLAQHRRLDLLDARLAQLVTKLDTMPRAPEEPRTLEDERPPHY